MHAELDIEPLHSWCGMDRPVVIAGPCGAESFEQLLETARGIAAVGKVSILRAGVWKPRTRPASFQGRGTEALVWLREVKAETGLPAAVEVANAGHVEEALAHGIDVLWLGARTTVNPFYVQEIADALSGVDVPVLVKNPVNPDLALWVGALERVNRAGIRRMAAIHRGFSTYAKTPYRNAPNWKIPIELKRLLPALPVICDISHIAGNRQLLLQLAQKALDLEMNGLMVETHFNPEQALSDADQQVTPSDLATLLQSIVVRSKRIDDVEFENTLELLRDKIDNVDHKLIEALARRMELVRSIGEYKRDNNVTILQLERWAQVLRDRIPAGSGRGLDEDFVRKLYNLIHNESIRLQTEILNAPAGIKE